MNWFKTLTSAPKISKKDWLLTIIPALIWLTAFNSRHITLETHCAQQEPSLCQPETLFWPDRSVVQYWNPQADWTSNWTQYSAGILAVGVPALWMTTKVIAGTINPVAALSLWSVDMLLALQTTFWNGAANELIKIAVQRPRPFVYRNPSNEGKVHHSYSSFYSGHTSFAALASTSLVATLLYRSAPFWLVLLFSGSGLLLTLVTGALRIAAGVHFYTDVFFGLFAGFFFAILIQRIHRSSKNLQTEA